MSFVPPIKAGWNSLDFSLNAAKLRPVLASSPGIKMSNQFMLFGEPASCGPFLRRPNASSLAGGLLILLFLVLPVTTASSAVVNGGGGFPPPTYTVNPLSAQPAMGFASGWRNGLNWNDVATVTATPFPGYAFDHWTDGSTILSSSAQYSFAVVRDVTLLAVFRTLFPNTSTFSGLFYDASGIELHSSGSFTFTATPLGKFSGKLQVAATSYSMTGQFDSDGHALAAAHANRTNALTVEMKILSDDPDRISGTVSAATWSADLAADRNVFNARTNPAPAAGSYTLVVPGMPDSVTEPAGHGYGVLTVDKAGKILFVGSLADGAKVSQGATLSKDGQWPLYIPLYHGQGSLTSWLTFSNGPTEDFSGQLTWIKSAGAPGKLYQTGFSTETRVSGSAYHKPQIGQAVLGLETCQMSFQGGDLEAELSSEGHFNRSNSLTTTSNQVRVTFNAATGLFKGHFVNPADSRKIPFGGVALQKANMARGYFLGNDQSGAVEVDPSPPPTGP